MKARAGKQFRSKAAGSSDEEGGASEAAPSAVVTKAKKPKKQKGPVSLGLSFGDGEEAEDDGPVFKIKKSKNSRKFAKGLDMSLASGSAAAAAAAAAAETFDGSSAGRYDTEALAALKSQQSALPSAFVAKEVNEESEPAASAVPSSGADGMEVDYTEATAMGLLDNDEDDDYGGGGGDGETDSRSAAERAAGLHARRQRMVAAKGGKAVADVSLDAAAADLLSSARPSAAVPPMMGAQSHANNAAAAASLGQASIRRPAAAAPVGSSSGSGAGGGSKMGSAGDINSGNAQRGRTTVDFDPAESFIALSGSRNGNRRGDEGGYNNYHRSNNSLLSQVGLSNEQFGDDDDDDDDAAQWENEALKRGGIKPGAYALPGRDAMGPSISSRGGAGVGSAATTMFGGSSAGGVGSGSSGGAPLPTVAETLAAVARVVAQATEAQERAERELSTAQSQLDALDLEEQKATGGGSSATTGSGNGGGSAAATAGAGSSAGASARAGSVSSRKAILEEQFEAFKELRTFVASLVGCARAKQKLALELHDAVAQAVAAAGEARATRRQASQDDAIWAVNRLARQALSQQEVSSSSSSEGSGGQWANLGNSSAGLGSRAGLGAGRGSKSGSEASAFVSFGGYALKEDPEVSSVGGGVDEMGRDRAYGLRTEREERAAARQRRRVWAWQRATGQLDNHGGGATKIEASNRDDMVVSSDEEGDVERAKAEGGGGSGASMLVDAGWGSFGSFSGGGGLGLGSSSGGGGGLGLGSSSSSGNGEDRAARRAAKAEARAQRLKQTSSSSSSSSVTEAQVAAFAAWEAQDDLGGVLSEEDDSESESSTRATRKQELVAASRLVFADVSETFATLTPVVEKLNCWRQTMPQEYNAAYVNESLPAILAPYALVELAEWDIIWMSYGEASGSSRFGGDSPISTASSAAVSAQVEDKDITNMDGLGEPPHPVTDLTWVSELADFGPSENDASGSKTVDAADDKPSDDSEVVPKLVGLQVVPRLTTLLSSAAYDPYSSRQTRALVGAVGEVTLDFGLDPHQGGVPDLLAAPLASLRRAASLLAVPIATTPDSFLEAAKSKVDDTLMEQATDAGLKVMVAQLWRCLKLIGNACQWSQLVAPNPLAALVVRELLAKKVAPALVQLVQPSPQGWQHVGLSLKLTRQLAQSLPPNRGANYEAAWLPELRAAAPELMPMVTALEAQDPDDPHVALLRRRLALA